MVQKCGTINLLNVAQCKIGPTAATVDSQNSQNKSKYFPNYLFVRRILPESIFLYEYVDMWIIYFPTCA